MPQTLLGVLGLVLASLVSFNQQRNAASNYRIMVENEIEMAATGTIMHVLELVGSRSFDENSTPDGINVDSKLPREDSDFRSPSQFGSTDRGSAGCNLEKPYLTPECDDVDDVDGLRDQEVHAYLSNGQALPFEIDVDVDYVVDRTADETSSTPTRHKRVTVTAHSDYLPNGEIRIERVFAYDPIKAEMDYEGVYGPLDDGIAWGCGASGHEGHSHTGCGN